MIILIFNLFIIFLNDQQMNFINFIINLLVKGIFFYCTYIINLKYFIKEFLYYFVYYLWFYKRYNIYFGIKKQIVSAIEICLI